MDGLIDRGQGTPAIFVIRTLESGIEELAGSVDPVEIGEKSHPTNRGRASSSEIDADPAGRVV